MPLEDSSSPSSEDSHFFNDSFLDSFRRTLLKTRQFVGQGTLFWLAINLIEQLLDTFEYKPELSVARSIQDALHKYRFDKLKSPRIKSRRSSPASSDSFKLGGVLSSDQKDVVGVDGAEKGKYGRLWLQRYLPYHFLLNARKCEEFVSRFGTFSDPQDLQDQLQSILKSEDSSMCPCRCFNIQLKRYKRLF